MKRRTVIVALIVILGLALFLAAWMFRDPAQNLRPKVSLQLRTNQPSTNALLCFEVINDGPSPILCPDGWYVEFQDGTIENLSLAPSGDVRVIPGSTGTVSFPKPAGTQPWRLGASYYEEDIILDVKVQIDRSSLKQHLPPSASSVRGTVAFSDWID